MEIKKIVLVEPEAPGDHVFSSVRMPRLGLPTLGALLEEKGYQVEIYIGKRKSLSRKALLEADLVGISTTTSTSLEAYRISRYLRKAGVPVAIGGSHATFMADEAMQHADYVVRGEAEYSFPTLVDALNQGYSAEGIPGVSYWAEGEIVHNPGNSSWAEVDSIPYPDLSLIKNYQEQKLRVYPVITSRGCPYDCTFCSVTSMFGRGFRYRDNELMLQELEKYQGSNVFFVDDNFAANPRRTKELLNKMLERNISLKWWGAQVRAELAKDEELLDLMRKTNAGNVFIGFESINPETLEAYNKKQNVEDIKESIKRFHDYGIRVHGMFIFGGEGDTKESLRETADFAIKARIDTVQFLILTPLPGTETFKQLEEEGRLLTRNWELYDGHHVVFQPERISPEELQEETIRAYKKFYSFRNWFSNVTLTGVTTTLYRGMGWWLVRRWEKQNRWFAPVLRSYTNKDEEVFNMPELSRRVEAFSNQKVAPFKENLMQIYLSQKEGVFYLRIKGVVNQNTLKALYKELNRSVPGKYFDLVVKSEGIKFASEQAAERFSKMLNQMGDRARQLQVVCRVEDEVQKLTEHTSTIPCFDVVVDQK